MIVDDRDPMSQRQLKEIRLRNFRCFCTQQSARLAPITLLVGENSTGKTSLLAAVRAILQVANTRGAPNFPDFRAPPYDVGSFTEIVHRQNDDKHVMGDESFSIGFRSAGLDLESVAMDATFTLGERAAPKASTLFWSAGDVWIGDMRNDNADHTELGCANRAWSLNIPRVPNLPFYYGRNALLSRPLDSILRGAAESGTPEDLQPLHGHAHDGPSERDSQKLIELYAEIASSRWGRVPGPPIQSGPLRTYDPVQMEREHGFSMPRSLQRAHSRTPERRQRQLIQEIEEFGRTSGLFDEIFVKRLGRTEMDPFQLQVRVWSNGPLSNLMDVGYGVTQVLPLLISLIHLDGSSLYLLQQPEVHLHPSAQAALGSLFCTTAASGHQLIVETHSDYIVDRILLDIRDKRTDLKPDDVSILYFERDDLDVSIHSLRIDDEGNVIDAPDGYRGFFRDELKRVIDF